MIIYKPSFDEEELNVEAKALFISPRLIKIRAFLKTICKILLVLSALLVLVHTISMTQPPVNTPFFIWLNTASWIGIAISFIFGLGGVFVFDKVSDFFVKVSVKQLRPLYSRYISLELQYVFENETVTIKSTDSVTVLKWSDFKYYGLIENYIFLVFHNDKRILINTNIFSDKDLSDFNFGLKQVKNVEDIY